MQIVLATAAARAVGRYPPVYGLDAHESRNERPPGTLHFFQLSQRFGGMTTRCELCAGESGGVVEGRAAGLDEDEFIDDIPFPETQNYVKLSARPKIIVSGSKGGGRPIPAK
jgi:hypothetical protein